MYSTLACYQTANIGGLTRHAEMPLCKIFGLIAAFRERHLLVYTLLCQIIIAVVTFYSVIIISYYDTFSTSTPRAVAIRSSFNDANSTTPHCKNGVREHFGSLDALLIARSSFISLLPLVLQHRSEPHNNNHKYRKSRPTACSVLTQPYFSSLPSPSVQHIHVQLPPNGRHRLRWRLLVLYCRMSDISRLVHRLANCFGEAASYSAVVDLECYFTSANSTLPLQDVCARDILEI